MALVSMEIFENLGTINISKIWPFDYATWTFSFLK